MSESIGHGSDFPQLEKNDDFDDLVFDNHARGVPGPSANGPGTELREDNDRLAARIPRPRLLLSEVHGRVRDTQATTSRAMCTMAET